MNKLTKLLLGLSLLALSNTANAISQDSSIGFSSALGATWSVANMGPNDDWLVFNDGLDFNGVVSDGLVTYTSGDYTPITLGHGAHFNDFAVDQFVSGTTLWDLSFGGVDYSLDMLSLSIQLHATSVSLIGKGMMHIGSDSALGDYSLTLNANEPAFTWSSSAAVPEPAITLLLATGLIGFGLTRRMRKAA